MKYPDLLVFEYQPKDFIEIPVRVIRPPNQTRSEVSSTKQRLESGEDQWLPCWSPIIMKASQKISDWFRDEDDVKRIGVHNNIKVVRKDWEVLYGVRVILVRRYYGITEISAADWTAKEWWNFDRYKRNLEITGMLTK